LRSISLRKLAEAWGFATLLFVAEIYPVMNVNGMSAYHSSSVTRSVLVAAAIGMVLAACIYLAAVGLLSRSAKWNSYRAVIAAVVFTLICSANRYMLTVGWKRLERRMHPVMPLAFIRPWRIWEVLVAGILVWAVLALCMRFAPRVNRAIYAGGSIVLFSAALLGAIVLVNMGRGLHAHAHDAQLAPMREAVQSGHPRVVWIVLDELAYRQVFENRAPGLELPNMDAMRAKSYVYTDVTPLGYFTDLVIPSLLLGTQIDEMHYSFSGGLRQLHHSDGKWEKFDADKSLFGEAEAKGWNAGISGWWNPYCWLFSGTLQSCAWHYADSSYGVMRSENTVTQNLAAWAKHLAGASQGIPLLSIRVKENQVLLNNATSLLDQEPIDLVMIHLALPHGPFVYDRRSGQTVATPGRSYLDGLANADKVLGTLMQQVESSPRWAQTTLIVQGDHSWRTPMWLYEPGWTTEDQVTSNGGKFDDRPMLLIHAPGQNETVSVTEPVSLMKVHDVIESVLRTGKPSLP
jgi:hypothetical protein